MSLLVKEVKMQIILDEGIEINISDEQANKIIRNYIQSKLTSEIIHEEVMKRAETTPKRKYTKSGKYKKSKKPYYNLGWIKWSDEEIAKLMKIYPTHTIEQCAKILNRTTEAIKSQLKRYDLHKETKKPGSNLRRWTKEEIKKLKELYPTHTAESIGKIINRTTYAVTYKLSEYGLKKYEKRRVSASAIRKKTYKKGPKTEKGRKSISEAQKRRWARIKQKKKIWTKRNEAYLLRKAGKLSWKEIGDYCGVSPKAAYDKWYYLAKR